MSVASSPQAETRIVLSNVAWATFEALVAETDSRGKRFTYDRGYLEIMSPSPKHEWYHRLMGRMVEAMTEELNIPIRSGGASTLMDQMSERGIEPDECYYVANEPKVRGKKDIDLDDDPPPDLAIEVDISRSTLDKLSIYGTIEVPEVWFYNGRTLRVYCRQADGTYSLQPGSEVFPFLPLAEVHGFLGRCETTDETSWIRSFRAWVRTLNR
jgi:Uma2 family endonuclease